MAFDLISCAKTHEEDNQVLFDGFDVPRAAALITDYVEKVTGENCKECDTSCELDMYKADWERLNKDLAALTEERDELRARVAELEALREDVLQGYHTMLASHQDCPDCAGELKRIEEKYYSEETI